MLKLKEISDIHIFWFVDKFVRIFILLFNFYVYEYWTIVYNRVHDKVYNKV